MSKFNKNSKAKAVISSCFAIEIGDGMKTLNIATPQNAVWQTSLDTIAVIPFVTARSPHTFIKLAKPRTCRLIYIKGDFYSFADLVQVITLNPHQLSKDTLWKRHATGCNLSHLFLNTPDYRRVCQLQSKAHRQYVQNRQYTTFFRKPDFTLKSLSPRARQRLLQLNAVFASTLAAKAKGVAL